MEQAELARWLRDYVEAWRSYDVDQIEALFTEDARYRYHPYDGWLEGRDEIVKSWLSEQDDPESWDAAYEPLAIDGEVAIATGTSRYTHPDGSIRIIYENCFVIRFVADGRCAEFTEWFMARPG